MNKKQSIHKNKENEQSWEAVLRDAKAKLGEASYRGARTKSGNPRLGGEGQDWKAIPFKIFKLEDCSETHLQVVESNSQQVT